MREQDEVMGRGSGCYGPVTEIRDLEVGCQVLVKVFRKWRWNKAGSECFQGSKFLNFAALLPEKCN